MNVLEVKDIYKKLGKREIIKGINLEVKGGEIFGFLGPNGAGKTTTIRMMVGLIKPNKGTIKIMGKDIQTNRSQALSSIGCVVENPELYSYLSGRENLEIVAKIRKIPKSEVDRVIELVKLTDRINDKVKKYSLGMKQRLGLAVALLAKPKLLILDEPTNGLDPTGMLDFREIVRNVAKETNAAVFISSHILSEVQELCTRVAFINGGVIVSVEDVDSDITHKSSETVVIRLEDIDSGVKTLKELDFVKDRD